MDNSARHEVIVYFAGWRLTRPGGVHSGEVAALPWDSISYVNHAFWAVAPADGSGRTSFRQRQSGEGPRTDFTIVPLSPEADLGDLGESTLVPGLPRNHFAQYAEFVRRYPHVNILISIGGWTRCGYFSEMAYTAAGRSSFIRSCILLMQRFPWIGGIDIDWEYPAGTVSGERMGDGNDDEGCPIFGTAAEDRENFVLLLRELRHAMDETFGKGTKKLTACASGSVTGTLPCQDWVGAAQYLDMINIMSYDLAGPWDGVTGHTSAAALAAEGAEYFLQLGVPASQLCIGSPLYSSPFRMVEMNRKVLGATAESTRPDVGEIDQSILMAFEEAAVEGYRLTQRNGRWQVDSRFARTGPGWHVRYDEDMDGAYMYCDCPDSPYDRCFLSYENPLSLQKKLDDIVAMGLGGIIVWESSQDSKDYQLIGLMGRRLLNNE